MTVACLAFDLRTGRVTGASAGHNALLLVAPVENRAPFSPSSGMVAGLFPGRPFTESDHGDESG